MNISLAQLSPNALRTLVGMLALFKLNGHRLPTPERFRILYQIKDNHNSVGLYSLSSWTLGNLVIGNPESEKICKEELVLVTRKWYSSDTPIEDTPSTEFELARVGRNLTFMDMTKSLSKN